MITTHEALVGVRALLSDPNRWCQTVGAQNAAGIAVPSSSSKAVRWCVIGALWKLYPDYAMELDCNLDHIRGQQGLSPIADMNDNAPSHAAFLAELDKFIELVAS